MIARTSAGERVDEHSQYLGPHLTNMQAEYHAVRIALERALAAGGVTKVEVLCDCKVVVDQLNGDAQTKDENLAELRAAVVVLIKQFEQFSIEHIYKEMNSDADALAKRAARRGW